MIASNHSAWADWIFHPYLMWLFKRHFKAIYLLGKTPEIDPRLPLLLLPNHSTWWDGFFVYLLNKKIFHRPAHLMMLEENLVRYRFLARLGVFSVNPNSPASIRQSLKHSAMILNRQSERQPMLCIFPQGALVPWDKRPLAYKRGVEVLMGLLKQKVNILPLAIKAEFLREKKAEVFLLLGENKIASDAALPGFQNLEAEEEKLLDQLNALIHRGEKGMLVFGNSQPTI